MPVQTQMSSFAKKHGQRVAQANEEYKDKPVDTGNQRLPAGIKNGVAKLSSLYVSEYKDGDKKGKLFFRASAITMTPESVNGQKVAGTPTTQMFTLDDVPAKGDRKAHTFEEGYGDMQNLLRLLGVPPCPETKQTDPTGQKAEAYWIAAMRSLTSPQRGPVYISYSTRGWTPPNKPGQAPSTEMVFEEWHGLTDLNQPHDPAAGVVESQPDTHSMPPHSGNGSLPPPAVTTAPTGPTYPSATPPDMDPADEIAALVEVAMADPDCTTEEGTAATSRLEQLAWQAGWSKEQTKNADDWAQVGDMAVNPPEVTAPPSGVNPDRIVIPTPTVGGRFMFAKRTKDGAKLKNAAGVEFPPQEVEVLTVDAAAKTCTLKTIRDGKTVVAVGSKTPTAVKFEWLEVAPPY